MKEASADTPESKYQNILLTCLESIRKAIPSKHSKDFATNVQTAIDLLKNNKDTKRDANQFFPLFKEGIELQNKTVTDNILKTTRELIALGYLDGDCEDYCSYPDEGPIIVGKYPRRLIDGIIETIATISQDQDENVQLQVVQLLLTIVTSFICKVHERSLMEVFRSLYYIHISTKNPVNYATSKAALNQIIHITYQRMEISYWRDTKVPHSMTALMNKEEEKTPSRFTILDEYMYCTVYSIVDEVCLYNKKQELRKGTKETIFKEDLNLSNERSAHSGKYGWCIACRSTANQLCKATHLPVCSSDCGNRHTKMLEMLETYLIHREEKTKYVEDVLMLFKSVCKLSQRDIATDVNAITLKSKILSLELILSMVQNPPESIRTHPDFLTDIKEYLSESILKNSVSNEKQIFSLSFSIFSALFVNFRSMLKNEIGVFIEEIFLKILESGNSSYQHKFLILQVFHKIAQNPKFVLEIFVNYDCDIETRNIFERIIDCLGKIAKGRYAKTEHAIIIQPEEEHSLKLMALETMTSIVKNCYEYMVSFEPVLDEQKKANEQEQSKAPTEIEYEEAKSICNVEEKKYEKALKNKTIMNKAVLKFNIKPKNGISYLIDSGHISKDPPEAMLAETLVFIKNTPGLDKSKIGEYFGEDSDFAKKVMHAYIDSLIFAKMSFVAAMRLLVAEFRLPGESQKIDRILMKFGQKYYQDNPSQFVSANAPYELSYAVMILQTATHNPQVKQKMTFEGFLSMSKDIRRSYNLTDDFMKTIFEDIKINPIVLADDEVAKLKQESALANGIKKKQDLFIRETQHMVKKGKELILKKKSGKGAFEEVKNAEPLRAMFEVAWSGMLAVFSSLFEEYEEEKIWHLCLEGFRYSIKITAMLDMSVELDAFMSILDKFTLLKNLKDIKPKNLECIKLLIDIAMKEGNYLRKAWLFVLESLSKLDYLHSVSTTMKKDYASPRKFDTAELEGISKVVKEIDQSKLDAIFSVSIALDSEGITEFICNLCKVSRDELADGTEPRIFFLQKLVEVADLNMFRITFVWSNIWKDVSQHLIEAGTHSDYRIVNFAVDSLKQLAHKFLAKEELASYKYQSEFLKPFEIILEKNLKRSDIVDFLINCVANLCRKCGKNIKSGWTIVFNIIGLIGKSIENAKVIAGSFGILNEAIQMHYEYLTEFFENVLSAILQYCGNQFTDISMKAIEQLVWSINEALNPSSKLVTGLTSAYGAKSQDQSITVVEDKYWTLLLRGLQGLILDRRLEIREKSAPILWHLLKNAKFSPKFWETIYDIILGYVAKRFFQLLVEDEGFSEYVKSTLIVDIDIFCNEFPMLERKTLDFIEKVNAFILETNIVAGVEIHRYFIEKFVAKCREKKYWENIVISFQKVMLSTLPRELLEPGAIITSTNGETKLSFEEADVLAKSLKHFNILNYVRTIIVNESVNPIPIDTSMLLLDAFKDSAKFAHDFNINIEARTNLKKAGLRSQNSQLKNLVNQEKEALFGYFELGFELYRQHLNDKEGQTIVEKMWTMMKMVLEEHIAMKTEPSDETETEVKKMITSKQMLISDTILPIIQKLPIEKLTTIRSEAIGLLLDLIVTESLGIRLILRDTLKVLLK